MDEFVTWANCGVGELWCGRIAIRPYDTRKRPHTMPVMLFAYNICQRSDNALVGANCNSPFHMGEFEMWMNFATWVNFAIWANCITYSAAPARGLCPYDARKLPHTMPMTSFLCIYMIYMYICQCPDNTRVGANCNSPSPVCEQFTLQTTKKILKNKK